MPGLAGQFMGALLGSHYYVIAFGTELIGGALLLSNRYVPLALTMLGPVIVNNLSFHMFLDSENMASAIVVTVLWFLDLTGEICTRWNERESTWRKSGPCQSRGTSQNRS